MEFYKHSGIYTLKVKQQLKVDIEAAWEFFSNPNNLNQISPANLGFKITSVTEKEMYEGQIITYMISIFPFFYSNWVTEITKVKVNSYFVDEQRVGPYKMWHHEHIFKENIEGVEMTDKVTFALPFSFLGYLAYRLFIKNKLSNIFKYRKEMIGKLVK